MMNKKADSEPENTNGYVWVYVGEDYPSAMSNGYVYKHRYVMEKMINRPLRDNEQVQQHKDGNQRNNTPGNLELWIDDPTLGLVPKSVSDAKKDDYKRAELKNWKKRKSEKKRRKKEKLEKSRSVKSSVLNVVKNYLANGSNM